MSSIVFSFGRLNPPTTGHGKLLDALKKAAAGSEYRLYMSKTQDKKKNPLSFKAKVKYVRAMFPKHSIYVMDSPVNTVFDVLVKLQNDGFESVTMVVGSDRVSEFKSLISKYNGKKSTHGFYDFKDITVKSAGERDPDAEGVEGMSASKMRAAAISNNFKLFKTGLPSGFKKADSLFKLVQKEMNIKPLGLSEWLKTSKYISTQKMKLEIKPSARVKSALLNDWTNLLTEAEELSQSEELQRAIELVESIDSKIVSIDGRTKHKDDNSKRITITQVVDDKHRIKFSALAREIIESDSEFKTENVASARAAKDYHFSHKDLTRSVYVRVKPSGVKGQVRDDPNELLTGIFACLDYKDPENIEELDALIDKARDNVSKSKGHTQGQIDLFDKAYTNVCQAISAANALKKMLGGQADKVFMTGVKWPNEVAHFKRNSYGMKDFNSSDLILKKGETYFGVSLKKKPSKKSGDPTVLNKAFDTILNGPDLVHIKEELNVKKSEFYVKVIKKAMKEKLLIKKPVNTKNWKTFLGGGREGTKTKLGNDYVNASLKSSRSLFKEMSNIIKDNEKPIAESLINLVLKMDLQELKDHNFMFSLVTGNGRYGPRLGAVIEKADVYEIDTIVEKLDKLGWKDKDISIEFNSNKRQAFDVGATAATLSYVVKVGGMDILQIQLRYAGTFTSQPKFLAVFTNKFKTLLQS
jgi:hypothetical protein